MNKSVQKIIVIVSGLALLVTMTAGGFFSRQNSSSHSQGHSGMDTSPEERLKSMVEGYEAVLQREPDNPTAKQGLEQALRALIATQIQAQNLAQAIPPMEKLVTLVPDNEEYQQVLQQMKQAQAAPPPTQSTPTESQEVNPESEEPLPLIIPEAQEESNPLLNPQQNSNPLIPSQSNPDPN
ncbi:tetratricopeptide repeat protein [Crocosphaera sp. Alani8]|uniref:tetratricopeptide repeat protein n=1 Tax=Crocosphaera sp. Alani8 TaxID=3038952 RepID=UPI00313F2F66